MCEIFFETYLRAMLKRADSSRLRHEFWTTFGKYMSPVPSAGEEKVNWINYRTGIKDMHFRMDASNNAASICITIEHTDAERRKVYFEKLQEHKFLLEQALGETWTWEFHTIVNENKSVSKVCQGLKNKSVFRKEDWPDLISFFKQRMIALDEFWTDARYSFEYL